MISGASISGSSISGNTPVAVPSADVKERRPTDQPGSVGSRSADARQIGL